MSDVGSSHVLSTDEDELLNEADLKWKNEQISNVIMSFPKAFKADQNGQFKLAHTPSIEDVAPNYP